MADLAAVAERHSAMVLKVAAGVDEHAFAHVYVPAEVCVERGEDTQRAGHLIAEEFGQHGADFGWCVVSCVQPERDAPRLVAHVVHQLMDFGCVERAARLYYFQKFT